MLLKIPALLTTASSRPKLLHGRVDDRLPALGAVDRLVGGDRHSARVRDLGDDLVGDARSAPSPVHGAAEIVDDHGGAPPGQLEGVEPAESAARAGDDGDLAIEIDHGAPA